MNKKALIYAILFFVMIKDTNEIGQCLDLSVIKSFDKLTEYIATFFNKGLFTCMSECLQLTRCQSVIFDFENNACGLYRIERRGASKLIPGSRQSESCTYNKDDFVLQESNPGLKCMENERLYKTLNKGEVCIVAECLAAPSYAHFVILGNSNPRHFGAVVSCQCKHNKTVVRSSKCSTDGTWTRLNKSGCIDCPPGMEYASEIDVCYRVSATFSVKHFVAKTLCRYDFSSEVGLILLDTKKKVNVMKKLAYGHAANNDVLWVDGLYDSALKTWRTEKGRFNHPNLITPKSPADGQCIALSMHTEYLVAMNCSVQRAYICGSG